MTKRLMLLSLVIKYGNVSLLEAWKRENNKRGGRPRSWDTDRLFDLFWDLEAAKARGMGQRQACVAIGKFHSLELKNVEKRYAEARKHFRFDRVAKRYNKGEREAYFRAVLDLHIPNRPDLVAFLDTYKGAAETRRT